jgi:hypothetical protein
MKIALIGATGFVGNAILKEALSRDSKVTAIARNPAKLNVNDENLSVVEGDVMDKEKLAEQLKGHDIVISAYNPGWTNPDIYNEYLKGAQNIQEATKQAGVKRLFVIGGAGSLYLDGGLQVIDTFEFPEEYKPGASAAKDYLDIIRKEKELDWTFLSPAIEMNKSTSGKRKATYRIGLESPVFNNRRRSLISVEDLAVAVLDETENAKHIRKRFTVGY